MSATQESSGPPTSGRRRETPPPSHLDPARIPYTSLLIADWESWVRRRVETITILDEYRIRRHVSVDFALPTLSADVGDAGTEELTLIPVTLLQKSILRNFHIFDENGKALPILTATETNELSTQLLATLSESESGETIDPKLLAALVATARRKRPIADLVNETVTRAPGPLKWPAIFPAVASDLVDRYRLIAWLPARRGDRRVIKYEYESLMLNESVSGERVPARSTRRILLDILKNNSAGRWLRRNALLRGGIRRALGRTVVRGVMAGIEGRSLLRRCKLWLEENILRFERWAGLRPFGLRIAAEGIGRARSYHMEVAVPEGLAAASAILQVTNQGRRVVDGDEDPSGVDRVHLYLPQMTSGRLLSRRGQAGSASIRFLPRADELLRQALVVSILVTGVLFGGLVAHWMLRATPRLDAATGLVVALPAVFAAYLLD